MDTMAEYVDGLPNLCGQEPLISEAIAAGRQRPVFPGRAGIERAPKKRMNSALASGPSGSV